MATKRSFAFMLASSVAVIVAGCPTDTCINKACDSSRWLLTSLDTSIWPLPPWSSDCLRTYRPSFLEASRVTFASIDLRPHDLTLALALQDGTLLLADFGASDASVTMQLGAVGVAWSNGGERLAVVAREAGGGDMQHTLLLFDEDLNLVDERQLDISQSDVHRRLIVSWNADDSRIAVSTDLVDFSDEPSAAVMLVRCVVVDVVGNGANTYALSNVHFIGHDRAVALRPGGEQASPAGARRSVFALALRDGQVSDPRAVPGIIYPLDSHAPTGVFAALEPEQALLPGTRPIVIRTVEFSTLDLIISDFPFVDLRPIEEVEAALIAAGFGPGDFVQPNADFSCPDPDPDTP